MKKIRKAKKFKTISTKGIGSFALSMVFMLIVTVFGLGSLITARAAVGRPQFNKTYVNNGDGTYTLSLDVTGKSTIDVNADKVNVVIIIDTSGSMSFPADPRNPSKVNGNSTVGRYRKNGDDYWRLYYEASDGKYYPEGTNPDGTASTTRHEDVYFASSIDSNGTISWSKYNGDRYNFTNNNTRLDETKIAVKNLISTLLSQNNNAANVDDVVEISLMTFSTYSQFQSPTSVTGSWVKGTNATTLNTIVDGLMPAGGTNWDLALYNAISLANRKNTNEGSTDETYFIFFSDGEPTVNNDDTNTWWGNTVLNNHDHSSTTNTGNGGSSSATDRDSAYYHAKEIYNSTNDYSLYGIFAYGDSTGQGYMKNLVSYGNYGNSNHANSVESDKLYFSANNQTQINEAFNSIATAIANRVGVSSAQIIDGTTESVSVTSGGITDGMLKVNEDSYQYWLSFPVTKDTTGDGYTSTADNSIKVVPASVTGTTIKKGTFTMTDAVGGTYTVTGELDTQSNKFKFEWKGANQNPLHKTAPPEATYENYAVNWDLSTLPDNVLLNNVTYTVSFEVYPSQTTLDLIADMENDSTLYGKLDPSIKQYLTADGNIKTNTTAELVYIDSSVPEGEAGRVNRLPFNTIDGVPTMDAKTLSISKTWSNLIPDDPRVASKATLYINRDGVKQYELVLTPNASGVATGTKAISVGLMTTNNDGTCNIKAPGHDYSFSEDSYTSDYWEIDAPVVHPMYINGEIVNLRLLEEDETVPTAMTQAEGNNEGFYYNDEANNKEYYKIGNKHYIVDGGVASLSAVNERRSVLEVAKTVEATDGADLPGDTLFYYNATITDAKGKDIWFSIEDKDGKTVLMPDIDCDREVLILNTETKPFENIVVDPETHVITYDYVFYDAAGNETDREERTALAIVDANGNPVKVTVDGNDYYQGYTGYGYFHSGDTVKVGIAADQSFRFINLLTGSSYTIEELTGEEGTPGYDFVSVNDQTDSAIVSGEIEDANTQYLFTYTNKSVSTHVDVEKIWDDNEDQDGIRPTSVEITLYKNSVAEANKVKSITLDGNIDYEDNEKTIIVKNGETAEWKATFADLPQYNTDGSPIEYVVDETRTGVINGNVTTGYAVVIVPSEENPDDEPVRIYKVTNEHTPEIVNISGTKTWSDGDNADGVRPTSATINLIVDGNTDEPADTKVVGPTNWNYSFTGLPKYHDEGIPYTYTVVETPIPGYTPSNVNTGILNTMVSTSVSVIKAWVDDNDRDGLRPETITVTLHAKDATGAELTEEPIRTATVEASKNWAYTFENLPTYINGSAVVYSVTESGVPSGYTSVTTGNATSGFTITNTHEITPTSVSGEKTWSDGEYASVARPTSITVNLIADGNTESPVDTKTVTPDANGKWSYSFTGIPKYRDKGTEIVYTVVETPIPGYTPSNVNTGILNTMVSTSVSVTKAWVDDNDRDGLRPTSITVTLHAKDANGEELTEEPIKTATVSANTNWQYTFRNLPTYIDGVKVVYSVTESGVPSGYTSATTGSMANGFTITNTHEITPTSVSGEKTWSDGEYASVARPSSITVKLIADGNTESPVDTKTVTPDENGKWNYSFTGIPKYRDKGTEIVYTVVETPIPGYTPSETTTGILNTMTSTSVSVTKAWVDDNDRDGLRPDSITVTLHAKDANGEELTEEPIKTATVSANTNWQYTFRNLPTYIDGVEVVYSVTESGVPSGYTSAITGSMANGFTITNTHEVIPTSVSGTKVWNDDNDRDKIRPTSITVNLIADDNTESPVDTKTVTPDEDGNWNFSFTGIPKYRDKGTEIVYTVEESGVPGGYTTKITGNATSGFTITNTHVIGKTSATVTKIWNDGYNSDGTRPDSITVQLLANKAPYGDPVTLDAEHNWTYTWSTLPLNDQGVEIVYSIREDSVAGYDTTYTSESKNKFKITNTYDPETTTVKVTKEWYDDNDRDGIRPTEIIVNLIADGNTESPVKSAAVKASEGWTYTFTDIPKYRNAGTEIQYTISEVSVPGYTSSAPTGDMTNGYVIKNTHAIATISISGYKTWEDDSDRDGIRPGEITVNLIANGNTAKPADSTTVRPDENGNWNFSFTNVPLNENGTEIKYTVSETVPSGYKMSIDENNKYHIINKHTPETISIAGKKSWVDFDDNDNLRPDSITVNLIADGNIDDPVDSIDVTAGDNGKWEYSFTGLLKYRDGGTEIEYTVTEDEVPGYTMSHDKNNEYIIVNTHTLNELNINVSKVWDDNDDQDGLRLDEVEVKLVAMIGEEEINVFEDSEEDLSTVTLSEENKWTYTWEGLKEYYHGSQITYSVKEVTNVTGYSVGYSNKKVTNEDGEEVVDPRSFVITNTHTPETIDIVGTKSWSDDDDRDGIRPESITVNVIADGNTDNPVVSATVSEETEWGYSFTGLPKYAHGEEIEYTLTETGADGYTLVQDGYDITNNHEPEKVSYNITKIWVDEGYEDYRPEYIMVRVLANGVEVAHAEVRPDEDGNWTYTFSDLYKYEEGSLIEYTIVEDVVKGYTTDVTPVPETTDVEITNTLEMADITIVKIWDDYDNVAELRPSNIFVDIYVGETLVKTVEITEEDGWTLDITDLPKYDKDGNVIEYTLDEQPIAEYEVSYDGFTITNKHELGKGNGGDPEEEIVPPQTGEQRQNIFVYLILILMSLGTISYELIKNN